jgi:phage terminase large subunit-like protein
MLLADNEPGAEVYVAAADREQARILFRAASAMVEASPALKKRLVLYKNQIVRADDPTAFFQVLSADAATKHGPNIHCLIIDELHAQPNRELFEVLTRGIVARRQPLILLITTAGDDDESICYEEREYALKVLSGTVPDEHHLPVIFEATPKDDPWDPVVWSRVNPGLGVTIRVDKLALMAMEAKAEPRKRNDFLRYHLNRWVNQATAWIPVDWHDACRMSFDDSLLVGLDLAQKWDLAAFVVLFRRFISDAVRLDVEGEEAGPKSIDLNFETFVLPFFWIPEETMRQHEKDDGVPYSLWVKDGLVTATGGAIIDYSRIYRDITTKIVPRFPLLKQALIGYDPAFATDLATQLRDRAGLKVVEVLQNYTHMSEPAQIFEALEKSGRAHHDGNRVMRNHVENVAVKRDDAGRIRPVKPKKASKHIDGCVANLMALKSLMLQEPAPQYQALIFSGR